MNYKVFGILLLILLMPISSTQAVDPHWFGKYGVCINYEDNGDFYRIQINPNEFLFISYISYFLNSTFDRIEYTTPLLIQGWIYVNVPRADNYLFGFSAHDTLANQYIFLSEVSDSPRTEKCEFPPPIFEEPTDWGVGSLIFIGIVAFILIILFMMLIVDWIKEKYQKHNKLKVKHKINKPKKISKGVCGGCGQKSIVNSVFCMNCGTKL